MPEGYYLPTTKRTMTAKYQTPMCPSCSQQLTHVVTGETYTWEFIPAEGNYEADIEPDEVHIDCPKCGDDVGELLGDDVFSYQGEKVAS